jgi:hypothetical protein
MVKQHNYVTCQSCEWRVAQEGYDPSTIICSRCQNTRKVIDPKELLCNLCGGCICPLGTHNEQYPHGLFEAEVSGGYDSYHLFDTTNYKFSLCEECLRKIFIQCKIPPSISHYMGSTIEEDNQSDEEKWKEDLEYYEYRIWRDNGGHHQAYLNKKCNAIKECPNQAVYTRMISDEFTEYASCEEHKEKHAYSNSNLVKFISNVLKPFL